MKYIFSTLIVLCLINIFSAEIALVMPIVDLFPIFDAAFVSLSIVTLLIGVYRRIGLILPTILLVLTSSIWIYRNGGMSFKTEISKPQNKTLLTLNVGQFSNDTSKVSSVVKMIREVRPDVIALQEFGLYHKWPDVNSMSQEFAKRINCTYYHFAPHAGNIFGTAVFSKYPILHSDLIFNELSQTNEGWRFLIAFPSDTLNLINVHLESFNFQSENRLPIDEVMSKQLIQIRSVLSTYDSRSSTVFCGDLNNVAGSKVYTLIDQYFSDAALEKGLGWLPTLKTPPFRIDHIFYNQSIGVNSIELYVDAPSDHAALLVDFN